MPSADPDVRSQVARIGAFAQKSKHDLDHLTRDGLKAANVTRFEREVDPDNQLPPAERRRRAIAARRAHMAKLALKSAQARKAAAVE